MTILECRTCGAGSPVDEHFCPQCSRILMLGRQGDYFAFLGVPRKLTLDLQDLERRFRELSRQFHPDFFYNAPPAERLASLERSSYLNDAYRTLRSPSARAEYLLTIEGRSLSPSNGATAKAPPAMLAEVFALNEELDELREARQAGASPLHLRARLDVARRPIDARREQHERSVGELSQRWDGLDGASPDRAQDRITVLEALREQLLERNYITNLLATIDREAAAIAAAEAIAAEGSAAEASAAEASAAEASGEADSVAPEPASHG